MSSEEILEIVDKQWCDINDLMKLTQLGKNNAVKIRNQIKNNLLKQGYFLPKNLLPMIEVIRFLKIDLNYLKSIKNQIER